MFELKDNDAFKRAIERARSYKPTVRVLSFGRYQVSGSKGDWYDVFCKKLEDGRKVVSCSCPTRDDIVCKHGAVAALRHITYAEQLRSIK